VLNLGAIRFGPFANVIVDFPIAEFLLFLIIACMNCALAKKEAAPPAPQKPSSDGTLMA